VLELADEVEHLADELGIERGGDLVEQQRARAAGQSAGDGDALLLAAREPVGWIVLAAGEPEAGEQLARGRLRFGARDAERMPRREHDVLEHAQMREQVERLEDHPEPPAVGDRVAAGLGDHLAVEQHVAVVDLLEPVDAAQQRRLARAGRADQRDRLVLLDGEVDPAQHLAVPVGLGDPAQLEHAHAGAPTPKASSRRRCMRSTTRASGMVTHT
jgi:hypothetical protein